jgi:hypothetical protein
VAFKMTNREVDGVSVMELDHHIVLGEPRSRSPCCQNTSECSVIPPESMPSADITSSKRTSRPFRQTHIDEIDVASPDLAASFVGGATEKTPG